MRTIRPVALISMLALCALARAAEPVPTPQPGVRQQPMKPTLTVEQQLGNLQQQVATLQAQVAELRSVLLVSGNTLTIRTNEDLNLQVGRDLNSNVSANTSLRSSGQVKIEASGTLVLKGSTIQQN